jgi:predicted phage tail component-like protein
MAFTTEEMPVIAPKRQTTLNVQGRDGGYTFEDGYDNAQIRLACAIGGGEIQDRRKRARLIAAWLSGTGKLVFDYEPDIEYLVIKATNNISSKMSGREFKDEFDVTFECEPYQQQTYYNDGLTWNTGDSGWAYTDVPWNGYERTFSVTAGQSVDIWNAGTYKALPVIKLTGTAASVTFGGLTFNNLAGTVFIDCKNGIVYSQNGSTKTNRITDFSGDFPELSPGQNHFTISGSITNLIIEFDYKNTYL